ncbi:MAG: hypothetical protein WBA97_05580 [Actinophytocola sp.]|uniref:hypothetical protein n=1 Tax=Actinophytocola sp. TaxID=1872138 RepID=UPI003C725ACD
MSASTIGRVDNEDQPEPLSPTCILAVMALRYAQWGWLTRLAGDRLLLTTDDRISAVELPSALGSVVQHFLRIRMLAGPAVRLPGKPSRWLLLTQSAQAATPVGLAQLHDCGAVTHSGGTLVPLPPSRLETGVASWQVPPAMDGPSLPPFSAVVAAIRTTTETAGLR